MISLESRVRTFLSSRPDSVDRDINPGLRDAQRADFVFSEAEVICELKAIHQDTTLKIPNVLLQYGIRPANGRYDLSSVLTDLPNRQEIERAVWHAICSDLETDVKKANRQIREEKKRGLPCATGLLVLVNDKVPDLHPELLMHGIGQKLRKLAKGVSRFPHVNIVWIISEVFPPEVSELEFFLALAPNPLVPVASAALARIRQLNEEWQAENRGLSPSPLSNSG